MLEYLIYNNKVNVCCVVLQAKLDFVHQLYQQLLTGRLLKQSSEGSTLGTFSWTDLTILINEQLALLLNTINRSEEKVLTGFFSIKV